VKKLRSVALESLEKRLFLAGDGFTGLLDDVLSFAPIGSFESDDDDDGDDDGRDDDGRDDDDKKDDDDNSRPGSVGSGKGKKNDAPPEADLTVADRTLRGTSPHTIEISYTDDKKVRASTIGVADIIVTGPGGTNLSVTGVAISPDKDDDAIVATYSIAPPGGRWDSADNGAYTVTLKASEVFDTKSKPAASVSATFDVDIPVLDELAPTGTYTVENVIAGGATTHKITAVYTDDVAMNLLTVGKSDLTITGPGGERPVQSVSVTPNADATRVVATYTFDVPGAAWGPEDNGTYQITLDAGQVRDASDKIATAPAVSFTVNVPNPAPVDPGFGGGTTGGAVSTSFNAEAVLAQPDGKILVAGRTGNLAAGTSRAVLARFNPDGTLDSTFGTRGKITSAAGANYAYYAIALNATGQIFVAGTRAGDVLLSKYDTAGKLDTTFDKDGHASVDFGTADEAAFALGIAPSGAIVIAAGPGGDFAMARFLPTGILDPDFAQGGMQKFDLGSADDTPSAVAFQGDKAVIVGSSGTKVAVVRLRADGEADASFSGDGLLLNDSLSARSGANFADRSTAASVQPDGKLLLANRSDAGDFAIARLNAGGSVDNSFGTAGVQTIDFGGDDDADAIIVQDTGEILVIGTSNTASVATTAIAALDSEGELITTFGTGGKLTLTPEAAPTSRALHLGDLVLRAFGTKQPDGRVVVGTTSGGPIQEDSGPTSLRRLNVPGVRTTSMGTELGKFGAIDGKRTTYEVTDLDGTKITFSASRGIGTVYESGGRYNLVLTDGAGGASARIRATGGEDGRVKIGDVIVSGALRSLHARSADLSGTLYATGSIDRVALGELTGTFAAAGTIGLISLNSMKASRVMSGAGLGSDGKLGGDDADADSFGPGEIGTIRVSGLIEDSTISAGLDPVDGVFNNDDDRVIGGEESVIRFISAGSADESSRFIAGRIESLRLPKSTNVSADERATIM
jgi:uncharacterized delta-60 repeat protein